MHLLLFTSRPSRNTRPREALAPAPAPASARRSNESDRKRVAISHLAAATATLHPDLPSRASCGVGSYRSNERVRRKDAPMATTRTLRYFPLAMERARAAVDLASFRLPRVSTRQSFRAGFPKISRIVERRSSTIATTHRHRGFTESTWLDPVVSLISEGGGEREGMKCLCKAENSGGSGGGLNSAEWRERKSMLTGIRLARANDESPGEGVSYLKK